MTGDISKFSLNETECEETVKRLFWKGKKTFSLGSLCLKLFIFLTLARTEDCHLTLTYACVDAHKQMRTRVHTHRR